VSAIAVIDDDLLVRDGLTNLLRSLGYEVRAFESADVFLRAEEPGIDCVITDQQMPGLTGLELCTNLKSRTTSLPVIIITALVLDPLSERARRAGVAALLEKPVQSDALIAVLERCLGCSDS